MAQEVKEESKSSHYVKEHLNSTFESLTTIEPKKDNQNKIKYCNMCLTHSLSTFVR
ncbi:MAG: hypothetical protein INQ03_19830 [Candidatus Heimdallarchaeota archaeon]|nr:hypothetical protein [Candidatus Heimdallarchaeota archaeon]